ncbi:MAG: ATP-binding cassette domain-containing protein, partial [Muribaculaceae bacterium]|nr:ATP-binding cassette domain-containing protein [Muribaculaceae bacterium]
YNNGIKVGYLKQQPEYDPEMAVLEVCLSNDTDACVVLKEYEQRLINGEDITPLLEKMDACGAWDYEDRFKRILSQLKIDNIAAKIKTLSGGQVKRIAIAALLLSEPDMILLDEPTNHLDIDMIEWLEAYLSRSRATLLMVTHDRYFLDKVCNKIIEIEDNTIYTYQGNYNYYLEKRAERIELQSRAIEKAKNLYRTELDWMRRQPQARASKAKYRIDAFYDLQQKAQMRQYDNKVKLENNSGYIGSKIFEATNVCKCFGDKVILNNFNYIFSRYDKVGIVGDNGVGKSTFIKMLLGLVAPDSGTIDVGETVKFGYYKQELDPIDESKKVIDLAKEIAEVIYFGEKNSLTVSQFLNKFLFTPADQQKYVYKLSGGEKRRLNLALMLMKKPNFIILDEPTNDLDIVTLGVLEEYLEQFKGCAIIISHDRFFMDRSIEHLFVFEGNGVIKDFPGNYSEYRQWLAEHPEISNDKSNENQVNKDNRKQRDYS